MGSARVAGRHPFLNMHRPLAAVLCLLLLPLLARGSAAGSFTWSELPPLPDPVGFAAPYAGIAQGSLVVAGGANFPGGRPWSGARKIWHDRVFVLDAPDGAWREAGRLPRPLGYGVSLTIPEGVLCLGGSDEREHVRTAFLLRLEGGTVRIEDFPPLPRPLANASGALVGTTVYVAGGIERPDAAPGRQLWALDLAAPAAARAWRELEPIPGRPRMLAVAGAREGAFFLFSGVDLVPDGPGGLKREYLRDAWRYSRNGGWKRLADLPEARVAAPSPAIAEGAAHLLVLGGDDGEFAARVATLQDDHPGFPAGILAYHTITDTWAPAGALPKSLGPDPRRDPNAGVWPPVTTSVVAWRGRHVVPTGEVRPGVRTPRVLAGTPIHERTQLGWLNSLTLGGYLLGMLGIGIYCARRERTTDSFFRGGQRLPWWAVGLSIYATMLSSITYMALPAKAYATDWTYLFANVAILLMAPIVIALYLPFFRRLDVTSAYEYLEKRFSLPVRLFGSASFILFQTGRMAIVLYLPAIALATVSSLDVYTCILLTATLCILYTMIGGIEAVVWTDVVQTFVLLGGALLSLGLVIQSCAGGWGEFVRVASGDGKFFQHTNWWTPDLAVASVAVILFGSLFNNLMSYTASQDVVQRYVTTRDERQAARSIWTNALLALPGTVVFFTLGTALYVFYKLNPGRLDTSISNDQILPLFIVRELPMGVAGLVIAGIFAASQSTLSSSLNSVAAAWMTDFYSRFRPGRTDRTTLRLAQGLVLGMGIFVTGIACLMARLNIASLFDAFISVIGMTGGALAGLFVLGIFTQRAHGTGALIGALASVATLLLVRQFTSINFFLFGAIGTGTCVLVGYVASWVISAPRKPLAGLTLHDQARPEKPAAVRIGA